MSQVVSNGYGHTANPLTASTSSALEPPAPTPAPPEIEATLARLSAYRNVRGVMILSRAAATGSSSAVTGSNGTVTSSDTVSDPTTAPPSSSTSTLTSTGGGIVQSTGAVFQGESGKRYAAALEGVVTATARAVSECDQGDELKLMRIRTKRHELIITPDERYLLVVLQDPQ